MRDRARTPLALCPCTDQSENVTGRKVLVTGASGFVGGAVAHALSEAGHGIVALSRHPPQTSNGFSWIAGDLSDDVSLERALENCSAIVNVAGKTGLPATPEGEREFYRVNCDGAGALARTARCAGVQAFIHVSSTGIFGAGTGSFSEASLLKPANIYERSKAAGEQAVMAEATRDMCVTVVRPSNVFGGTHPQWKLLAWFRSVKAGRAVLIRNPAEKWVNYVYVGDVARAIGEFLQCGTAPASGAERCAVYILNTPSTVAEMFDLTAQALGVKLRRLVCPRWPLLAVASAAECVGRALHKKTPFTRDKVRELSGTQIFLADRVRGVQPGFPYFGLGEGLARTCRQYTATGLL
jgi:nucleoside-diphosphate-sugar epimerase